ncbi:uncharacterized protein LOC135804459 isoform X1 [Sycon ciliatum]|uniref:uncharacterized protein LOC135804459 isoform X1 n=1 Tax=Sycon ciliatum TaxID=27933 RepID=UPI0031F6F186
MHTNLTRRNSTAAAAMGFWKTKGKKATVTMASQSKVASSTSSSTAGEAAVPSQDGPLCDHVFEEDPARTGPKGGPIGGARKQRVCGEDGSTLSLTDADCCPKHTKQIASSTDSTNSSSSRSSSQQQLDKTVKGEEGRVKEEEQEKEQDGVDEHRDQRRQPVRPIWLGSSSSVDYDRLALSIGGLADCFDWSAMATDKGSTVVAIPPHYSLPHSFSASRLETFSDEAEEPRSSLSLSTRQCKPTNTNPPAVPPRRSSLDSSMFTMTNKHNSFPRLQRPPSATPHRVSDEIVETLKQMPQHRCGRHEETPALAVRRNPTESTPVPPEIPKKGGKKILKRMIPSRRSSRQNPLPTSLTAASSTSISSIVRNQETSIDGDLPSPKMSTFRHQPTESPAEKARSEAQKSATLPTNADRLATLPKNADRLATLPMNADRVASRKQSESITSVDTVGQELRQSVTSLHSSESTQSSPSCKKVIFGAYQQKPRRESTSLSRKEAKLAALRLLTLSKAYKAAESGDSKTLKSIFEDGSPGYELSVTDRNESTSTLLHVAADHGNVDCIDVVLAAAPSPHDATTLVDSEGRTPAMVALEGGHVDCLKRLVIASNGDLDTDECGNTLLHHACYHGKHACLQFLMEYTKEHDKDINDFSNDKGVTPAHVAGQLGHIECLRVLVEGKADIMQNDEDDLSALDWAKKDGQTLCQHYLMTIESCWSLNEQLESTQEQLDRSVHENASLRVQLAEARQSKESAQEEVQRITQESSERLSHVRQEFVSMITSIFQQVNKSTPSNHGTTGTLPHSHGGQQLAGGLRGSASQDKWKSVSLPRPTSRDTMPATSLAAFKSLFEFKDESDDSSDNESDQENLPIFMHSSSSNSSASSARVQNLMAKTRERVRVTRSVSSEVSTTDQSGDWVPAATAKASPPHRQTAV